MVSEISGYGGAAVNAGRLLLLESWLSGYVLDLCVKDELALDRE